MQRITVNPEPLSPNEHAGLRYLLRPARETTASPAPLLVFLHGYDEGAPMPIEKALTRHGPLHPGNPPSALAPFMIVAPQVPTRGDIWYEHAASVGSLVRHIQVEHQVDPARTYLSGFSFGANGVFDLALRQPEMWAALWAVDPTRIPSGELAQPLWLSFGEIARHRKEQFVDLLKLVPDEQSERVCVDDGSDHVGAATNAFRDPFIYRWLLARRLPNEAQLRRG
jgi:predicted peptidase